MSATLTAIAVISALLVGIGAGWGLKPVPDTADALAEQARAIEAIQTGQTKLASSLTRPIVIDAEIRSQLAEVPVQCLKGAGGDPLGVQCQWSTCIQHGSSSAQRPDCRAISELLVEQMRGAACAD